MILLQSFPAVNQGHERWLKGPVLEFQIEILVLSQNDTKNLTHVGVVDRDGLGDPMLVDEGVTVDDRDGGASLRQVGIISVDIVELAPTDWATLGFTFMLVPVADELR